VLLEARVDVFFVDEAGALGLGEHEVEEEEEADVGVKGDPRAGVSETGGGRRGEGRTCQTRNHSVHDSTRSTQARTTQYISHGVSWVGSDVLRAL
jgi:hypothetical protein